MFRVASVLSIVALLLLPSACSDDAPPGQTITCMDDTTCPWGTVCNNGYCQGVPCDSTVDCPDTSQHLCVDFNGQKTCVAPECGCMSCTPCPADKPVCQNGQCVPDAPVDCDPPCDTATHKCVDGTCQALDYCDGPEDCGEGEICNVALNKCEPEIEDCTVTACPDGYTCNEATKKCDPVVVQDCNETGCEDGFTCNEATGECESNATVMACTPCASDEACAEAGAGWECEPLGGAQACLPPCATSDDCEPGWYCGESGGTKKCTPAAYKCIGCLLTGCAEGETCNHETGTCTTPKIQCDECTYDWECGAGQTCSKVPAGGIKSYCVPRCTGGGECPGPSSCQPDADTQIMACKPDSSTCCFDPDPANCQVGCNPPCIDPFPVCKDGTCVECLEDGHCDAEATCDLATNQCITQEGCQPPTPYFSEALSKCVQCLEDAHCETSTCNLSSGTCTATGDFCDTCVAPYPACTIVGGEYYCVQCTEDAHCGVGGTCDLNSYSCEGIVTTPDGCETDADCDPGITGFNLKCDTNTGYCYDTGGSCDGVTAYCLDGMDCLNMMEIFGGGGGALPIPPDMGGGSTIPGFCECEFGFPSSKGCPEGVTCLPFGMLLELLGGGANPGIMGNFCMGG